VRAHDGRPPVWVARPWRPCANVGAPIAQIKRAPIGSRRPRIQPLHGNAPGQRGAIELGVPGFVERHGVAAGARIVGGARRQSRDMLLAPAQRAGIAWDIERATQREDTVQHAVEARLGKVERAGELRHIALDNRVAQITDEHKIAAAEVIAGLVEKPSSGEIIPSVFNEKLVPTIARVIR
jgi:hypothetical protein